MNEQVRQGQEVDVVTQDGEIVTGHALPDGYDMKSDVDQTLAVALTRVEIDQQIATARAMPRTITRVLDNILSLVTLDEETAEECIYALPRDGKAIRGPSIRLAEILHSQWGNCRVGTRVVHVDRFEKYVEAEGVWYDMETGSVTTARVRRRISDRKGKLLNEDMIIVTGNAACAIAKRNAILAGVPKPVWRKAFKTVEDIAAGTTQTLTARRDRAMAKFARFGVVPEQVFAALSVGGPDDVTTEHLPTLTGMFAALKSGESNVEEMFPKVSEIAGAKGLGDKLDALANGGEAAEDAAKPPAEKKTRKASAPKAEEAAGADAGNKAGASQSPQAAAADPAVPDAGAPVSIDQQQIAAAAPPAAAAQSADAPAPSSPGASVAQPVGLNAAARTGLQRLHADMMGAMGRGKIEKAFATFVQANELSASDLAHQAAVKLRDVHFVRVGGDGSPAAADAVMNEVTK